ncbi:hypothetical protein BJ165DRAFT_1513623, partial [Panaeolus papilionaceus]
MPLMPIVIISIAAFGGCVSVELKFAERALVEELKYEQQVQDIKAAGMVSAPFVDSWPQVVRVCHRRKVREPLLESFHLH